MRCLSNDKSTDRCRIILLICFSQAIFLSINIWWVFYKDSVKTEQHFGQIDDQKSNISTGETKKVSLFVAILTHAMRRERRDGIRESWMSACKENPQKILCGFFTDEVGLNDENKKALDYEKRTNNDIVIINATGKVINLRF